MAIPALYLWHWKNKPPAPFLLNPPFLPAPVFIEITNLPFLVIFEDLILLK